MKFTHLLCIFAFCVYSQISYAGRYLPIFLTDLELVERIEKYDDKNFIEYGLISGSNYYFDEHYVSPDIPFSVGLRYFFLGYFEHSKVVNSGGRIPQEFSLFYDKDPEEHLIFDFEKDRVITLIKIATDNEKEAEAIFYKLYRDFLSQTKQECYDYWCYIGSQYIYDDIIINFHGRLQGHDKDVDTGIYWMDIRRRSER